MIQTETAGSNDCGARALAEACTILGLSVPYRRIIELARPCKYGISLLALKNAAEDIGLNTELLRTNYTGLCLLSKPVIVHLHWNHFDVISQCNKRTVNLPGRSLWKKVPFWLFKLEWSGIVMTLSLKQER